MKCSESEFALQMRCLESHLMHIPANVKALAVTILYGSIRCYSISHILSRITPFIQFKNHFIPNLLTHTATSPRTLV
jgi:hypothetical protein